MRIIAIVTAAVLVGAALVGCAERCETRAGSPCDAIPLEELEGAFDIDLPDGTTVVESSYEGFQDWRLAATFDLPDDSYLLPSEWAAGEQNADGAYREAELDGDRLTLALFTT